MGELMISLIRFDKDIIYDLSFVTHTHNFASESAGL